MTAVLEQINSIGKAFVEFAVPMLVQSGVLIVILLLIDLALRKKVKAVFRYCIWMLVLLKLILPTSLSSPLSLGYWFGDELAYVAESQTSAEEVTEPEALEPALANMLYIIEPVPIEVERPAPAVLPMMPDVEPAVTEAEVVGPPAAPVTPVTWQGVVFLLWLAVAMALGLLLLQRSMFVRGLVAQAKEGNALMNDALEYCCKCMGVKRKVGLKVSANAAGPAVCGLFRPVILLPHKLAPSLGSRGLRAVLLHELAHIRRRDLWVNLVQTVLQIMYFYNPLLWVANCVIRRVREQAIDETVLVAMGEKAQQYPQALVNVAKLAFKRPVLSLRLIGVVESKSALAGRIKHILNRPMPKSAKIGIVGVLAVIIAGAILLPMAKAERRADLETDVQVEIEKSKVQVGGELEKIINSEWANVKLAWYSLDEFTVPVYDRNAETFGQYIGVEISKTNNSYFNLTEYGLENGASPEELFEKTGQCDFYMKKDYALVPLGKTLIAPIVAPATEKQKNWTQLDYLELLSPEQIIEQMRNYIAKTSLGNGKGIKLKEGQFYCVIADDDMLIMRASKLGTYINGQQATTLTFANPGDTVKPGINIKEIKAVEKKTVNSSNFTATLPNGVTVELVGVCDIPDDGKQWWAADGSPVENVYWDGTTNREDAENARQMVFRVRSNDSDPDLAPTASFQAHRQQQPPGSWSGAFVVSKDNQTLEDLHGCSFSLHDDHPTVDISATVGYGPWETQSTLNVSSANDVRIILTKVGKMVWSEPFDKGGKTNISVTLTKMPKVKRIVATDKQGNKIHAESMFASSWDADGNAGGMAVAKAKFSVPLSRIDKFHFQTRKAKHITFKNVSLRPGVKSDAGPTIAEAQSDPAMSAEENAESLEGITLVAAVDMKNIDRYRSLGIRGGFGNGQPICDFKATAKYVSRYGNALRKGDRFIIGSAKVSKSTDGYGNTGTKLILWSAAPKEGLVFFCYGFDRADKSFWAIDREKIRQALKGYFIVEGRPQITRQIDPQVEVERPREESQVVWGKVVDGLQLGLSYDSQERPYYQGEIVSFEVHARNNGDKAVDLSYRELIHWCPYVRDVRDANDTIFIVNSRIMGGVGSRREEHISLGPGDRQSLGKVALQIGPVLKGAQRAKYSADFEPGRYIVNQRGKFGGIGYDSWRGELKTGELPLAVLPAQTGIEPATKTDVQVEVEKPQSLIFHGLDLAAVPHTTNPSKLPDLFEERPLGSKSYHIQKDVTAIYSGLDGTVYFIPRRNVFYVQHDKLGSSTLTYYGPFEGNPVQILNLQPNVQVEVEDPREESQVVWGKAVQGVQVAAWVERMKWHIEGDIPRIEQIEKWRIGGDVPRVNVEVRISDPKQFQESGLAEKAMAHDWSAFALEINGKQYKQNVEYTTEPGPLQSPFKIVLSLDDEWQGGLHGQPWLNPGRHTIRVLFVGLGMKPPPASEPLVIEVLPDDKKLGPWTYPWGKAVRGVQVSAHPAQPSWPVGSEPVIRICLRNQGKEKWSIHERPSSFAVEVDGKRYENNFIFHVWRRPFAPGDVYQFDLKLSKSKPFHDGLRKGNSWPPVGKPPPLLAGKHTIRVLFTELRIEPEPASNPVEIEIVPAGSAVQVEVKNGFVKGPWWQVSTKDANTGLVIKRKAPPSGTSYFMKFDKDHLLELVSSCYGQDITNSAGNFNSGERSRPQSVQKHVGFMFNFAPRESEYERITKRGKFRKELLKAIRVDIEQVLGVRVQAGGNSKFLRFSYTKDNIEGNLNVFLTLQDNVFLMIQFSIHEVITTQENPAVQVEPGQIAKGSDTQNQELSFGPVTEIEIPLLVRYDDIFQKAGLVDFETGRLLKLPQEYMELKKDLGQDEYEARVSGWCRENGIDAAPIGVWFIEVNAGGVGLVSEELAGKIFLQVTGESWDSLTPEELLSRLQGEQLQGEIGFDGASDTFAFRTIEGNIGLLKALSVTDNSIKIRYKMIKKSPDQKTDVQVEVESKSHDLSIFESYFPDDVEGGKRLDELWGDRNKDLRDADEILETVRKGLRRYSGSGNILRWIGNLFIWGKNPQNEKAIELMYHASGSSDRGLYGEAIYFGLSVTKNKTPEILRAMAAVAMKTDDYYNVTGRILWGCRNQKDEIIACLEPYLNSDDETVRQKARDVKDYFMDSKAFMAKRAKEHEESVRQEYGNKLVEFKEQLLNGNSQSRMDTLQQLQSKSVMSIVDESFIDAFGACTKDMDPQVRTKAARMMGGKFVWSGKSQNKQAIEILTELLDDADRSTRGAAVYYGLSTIRSPDKELVGKMLATILDDREINYYGRVIWGIRRNKQACVEILKEWMDQSEQASGRALKAYEIYEDVSAQQLPEEYAQRFAGEKSDAHEGLVAMCFQANPVSKEELQKQFFELLTNSNQIQKVLDFYIIESRETAVGMFICDNLSDRNAIRSALAKDGLFQVAGYMHGKIGPTGSGWIDSLKRFRIRNELNRVSLPKPDARVEGETTGAEAGIEGRIRAVIDKFWAAVEADDFGRVRQLSQIDMLEKRGALGQTLKEVNEERKQLLSRGIDISKIMDVHIRGDEAVAVGNANKDRLMWYYLEKGPDGWLIKLFDDAPQERTIEEIFTQSRGHTRKTDVQVEGAKKPATSRESKMVPAAKSELQRLIDSARAGGTVIVPKGVYTEPIEINKSLTLKGKSRADCVFEVTTNRPAVFVDTKGKGRVTIQELTIKWQLATSDRGIEHPFAVAVKDTRAEVKNCNFVPLGNFKRCPVAIQAIGFSNLTINTCRFEGFEYTVCYGEGTEGTIQDSLVMGSGHQGISLYSGATVKIIRNVVTGSKYHGVRSTGGTLDMKDNLIIENANRGVYLGNKSAHGTITNNIITGNRLVGISGFAQSDVKIYNNLILDSGQVGIGAQPSCRFLLKDNIIKGNPSGIVVFLKEGAKRGNLLIHRNTFWNNETDTENCEKAPQSISEEPAFRDPANGDFSLASGKVMEQKQGLTDPKVFKALWKRWKNRADKTAVQVEGEGKNNEVKSLEEIGVRLRKHGRVDEAIGYFKKAIDASDSAEVALQQLGEIYSERGDYERSLKYFEMFLKIRPKNEVITAKANRLKKNLKYAESVPWGKANNGLQIRLIIPKDKGEEIPIINRERFAVRLEVRNVSDKPIKLAEQNMTGGRKNLMYDWLIGLTIGVRQPGRGAREFFRADDQDGYWSRLFAPSFVKEIKPNEKAVFKIQLRRLVDYEGTNLLSLRSRCDLRPVLLVRDDKFGLWHGHAVGTYIPLIIKPSSEKNDSPHVQVEGESEVSKLVEQLQSENRRERCQAALELESLGDRRGVPALIKELNDTSYRPVGISPGSTSRPDDPEAKQEVWVRQDRYYAALLLGTLKDKRAVPALIEATRDETIDYQAAMSLGQIGDKRAIPALRDMLERCSNKPFPRLFSAYGLAMLGDNEGLKVVIDTLNDHQVHWTIRRHAIEALGKLGDKEAVPYLTAALKDEHPNIRVSAARALGAIGDVSALPALKQALEDKTKTKVNAPMTINEAAAKAIAQIEGETTYVEGLRCNAELIKNELAFGQGPELAVSLTNTTNEPIDIIGYCRNPNIHSDRYPLPCAQLYISPVGRSKQYRINSYSGGAANVVPEAVRIEAGKSWSFRFPPPKMKESTKTKNIRSSLPSLTAWPPGKYTAQLTYFIRESEIKKFGPGLVFGAEMGSLAGKKPDRIWQGVVQTKELVFEVLDDNSEQLRIRKAIDSGEGIEEHLQLELKASKAKVLLLLSAKNTGAKTLYLGGHYCLRGKGMGNTSLIGRGVPIELKPGATLELGGWNLSSIGPGTYWVEYLSNLSLEKVLKKSNTVTFGVTKPDVQVEGETASTSGENSSMDVARREQIRELIAACGRNDFGISQHMTLITHDTDETRQLVQIGLPAVPQLIAALKDPNKHVRRHAAYVLGKLGDKRALESLLECCRAENRHNAESGKWDNDVLEPAVWAVVKLLFAEHAGDHNWIAGRAGVIYALTRGGYMFEWERKKELEDFRRQYRKEHPTIFTELEDLDEQFRRAITDAAWEMQSADIRGIREVMIEKTPEREPYLRLDAVSMIARGNFHNRYYELGAWSAVANKFLSEEQIESFRLKKERLIAKIAEIGPSVVPELMPSAYPQPNEYPRFDYAREILKRIGPDAIGPMKQALQPPRRHAPLIIWSFFADIAGPQAEAVLREGLLHKDPHIRGTALLGLVSRGDEIDADTALAVLDSESPRVLEEAIAILVRLRDIRAIGPLRKIVERYEDDEQVPERRDAAKKAKEAIEALQDHDVQVEGEGSESKSMAVGGKGRVEALDPNAANLIRRYLHALEKSDWKTALSMCSISVMDKAQQYPTPESFFNIVVPVKEILNKLSDPQIGYGTRPPKYFAYIFDVRVSKPDMPRDVSWQWKARKLEGRANWEIDFPAIPFETWLANAKQVIIRSVKEKEQLIKEVATRLKGVRTLLAAEREEFVVGEPIYFRLRIINQGDSILSYDCQQVAVNNPMTIEGPDGKEIKYTAEDFQTLGGPVLLKPGETKTLFDQFDITKQYDIRQPGQYRVQYNGKGLSIVLGKEDPPDLNDPTSWKYLPGILPSNAVIITIHSGIKQETLDVGKDGVEGEKTASLKKLSIIAKKKTDVQVED